MKRMQMTVENYTIFEAVKAKGGSREQLCKLQFKETEEEPVFSADTVIGRKKLVTLLDWAGVRYMGELNDKEFMVVFHEPYRQIYALGNEKGEFIKVNGDEDAIYAYSEL